MNKQVEIFENEEATQFLDYFVAYMKLMDKVDNIKSIATQQNEMDLLETQPTDISQIDGVQSGTVLPIELNK